MQMLRKGLPIGVIVVMLVIALAGIGVAYGLWSKTLTIEGTVSTGDVNARFAAIDEVDEGIWREFNQNGSDDDLEFEGKNVADCSAALTNNNENLQITITNGYPSFHCWVEFVVQSTGSIPVRLHQPTFSGVPSWLTLNLTDSSIPYGCYHAGLIGFPSAGDPHPQLHRNDVAYCVVFMHVEQSAPQGATATFTGQVFAHQFNEEQ
jgi:hypothetical protein